MTGARSSSTPITTTFQYVSEPSVIRYTTDGSKPSNTSTLWDSTGPREPGQSSTSRRRRSSAGWRRTWPGTRRPAGRRSRSSRAGRERRGRPAPGRPSSCSPPRSRAAALVTAAVLLARGGGDEPAPRRSTSALPGPARRRFPRLLDPRVPGRRRRPRRPAAGGRGDRGGRAGGGRLPARELPRRHAHGRADVRGRPGPHARRPAGLPAAEQRSRLQRRLRARPRHRRRAVDRSAAAARGGRGVRATPARATGATAACTGSATRSCGSTATELPPALALCRALGPRTAADCAQGAYHDYWFAVAGADEAALPEGAATDPRTLCAAQPAEFVRPCWYRAFVDNRPDGIVVDSPDPSRRALRRPRRACSARPA